MHMELELREYQARKIVNVHKHVDGPWFWDKYSAHPYVGCRSGCEFCYLRDGHYLGKRDPTTFDTLIQVKTNAVELLRKELPRLSPDVIACGDWQQPAEDRYRLSRQMLQAILDFSFPLFVIERSPLLVRDLDLLQEINRKSWSGVAFSLSSLDPAQKHAFEPRSPGVKRRLQAMSRLASAGILVGASLMPLMPFIGDDRENLLQLIRAVKDHGGTFVLAGGLTLAGVQAERSLAAARRFEADLEPRWRALYRWPPGGQPGYAPPPQYGHRLGNLVRELCFSQDIRDRIPRYIPANTLGINKRIAELLFLKTYDLELENASSYRTWAYRKAAWVVEELSESIADIFADRGEAGLRALPEIGPGLAGEIAAWLQEAASPPK
jgi:DNA repair photolyase